MSKSLRTEHLVSLAIFWCSVALVFMGFCIHSSWSCFLFIFILPIMFGSHEATHGNIIPNSEKNGFKRIHNDLALLIGYSVQIMNFKLLRQSHLNHHALGRYGEGYSPDIIPGKPRLIDYIIYYSYLIFIPAILNQITGFILVFIPAKYLPIDYNLDLRKDKSPIPYLLIQSFCLFFLITFIYLGGIYKFIIYESFFVFMWCILQNSAHYGLKGINTTTDRVCSNTYLLERPFKILTFGSTLHLGHHVNMDIPCLDLDNAEVMKNIEQKIGVEIVVKHGILSFIKDILVQFKGPVDVDRLHTNWIKSINSLNQTALKDDPLFFYRKGIRRNPKPIT